MFRNVLTLLIVISFSMTFVVPSLAADYKLDSAHSSIIFKAKHLDIGYIYGMFLEYSGSVTYNPEKPKNTTFDVTVQTDSVFTNHRKRDNHLKSPDFFNAKQYPEITFESSSVEAVNDSTLRISADLTIRGVTESVTTDVKLTGSGKGPQGNFRRGFKSTFTINRLDYNVDFMPDSLSKEIPVTITGELIRQ